MSMIKVPLRTTCPPSCKCGSQVPKDWVHSTCQSKAFIDCTGDISCQKGCMNIFIKNVGFQCQKGTGYQDYKTATQFLMAFAAALQSSGYDLKDEIDIQFITNLNINIVKKWYC
ncbi:hypothetical protein pb186bvf_016056 [Paramecium bursaria]